MSGFSVCISSFLRSLMGIMHGYSQWYLGVSGIGGAMNISRTSMITMIYVNLLAIMPNISDLLSVCQQEYLGTSGG